MNKKMNKAKKNKINNILLIAIAIVFVVLVAVIIVANSSESRKVDKLFADYVEMQYGEASDLSAQHYIGDNANYWVADNYVYFPEDNIILDNTRITELNASVTEKFEAYVEGLGEDYTLNGAQYYIYTDASDLTKDYGGLMVYYIGSASEIFETIDDAAQFVWDFVESCGDVTVTGIDLNLFDSENEYYFSINPFDGNEITLEALKENVTLSEEKSTLYLLWQTNLALAASVEDATVSDETDSDVTDEIIEDETVGEE